MIDTANLSDLELLTLCQEYGEATRTWRQKFLGLLPEVHKRKLYEQKGFTSVFHFAKVMAGVSEEQVPRALNLDQTFEQMPALKTILNNGEASMHKIARIASIATPENQEELAEMVKILPKAALEMYVHDIKQSVPYWSVPGHKPENNHLFEQDTLKLESDITSELLELQQCGININEIIREALVQRKQTIEQEKEIISNECQPTTSRYIPAKTRKILKKEYGTKCSIKTCHKASEELHHSQRFSVAKTHDPKYLAPLCKPHHILAHTMDLKFHEKLRKA